MPVNIVLRSTDSPSGLGIRQLEERLEPFTGCCGSNVTWTWYLICQSCGLRQPGDEDWKRVIRLEGFDAVHKWTYDYMEEIQTWVSQWTGLEPKAFELNFGPERV